MGSGIARCDLAHTPNWIMLLDPVGLSILGNGGFMSNIALLIFCLAGGALLCLCVAVMARRSARRPSRISIV